MVREEVMDVLSEDLSYLVSDLNPFTEYTFRVAASTTMGEGPATDITEKTREQGEQSHYIYSADCFNPKWLTISAINHVVMQDSCKYMKFIEYADLHQVLPLETVGNRKRGWGLFLHLAFVINYI